jgi:nucleoside-diphosphate kinase
VATEQTFLMIKPEIVMASDQKIGAVLELVQRSGFRILDLAVRTLNVTTAEQFYAVHRERPFFRDLVAYITSGPVVVVRLEREEAVRRLRELIGATDPASAATGTLRRLYGSSLQRNAVHGSDSPENARREIGIVFGAGA